MRFIQKQKIVCDYCSKEQFKDKTQDWEVIEIEGKEKDFCSKKCSSKYIKNLFIKKKNVNKESIKEFPKYPKEEKNMKKKIREEPDEDMEDDIEDDVEDDLESNAPAPKKKLLKKKNETDTWTVANMPTQHIPVAFNKETEETLDTMAALARILNNQEKIMEAIG